MPSAIGLVAVNITVGQENLKFVYTWPSMCVFHEGDEKVVSNEIPFSA